MLEVSSSVDLLFGSVIGRHFEEFPLDIRPRVSQIDEFHGLFFLNFRAIKAANYS